MSGLKGIPNGLMRMGDVNDDGYAGMYVLSRLLQATCFDCRMGKCNLQLSNDISYCLHTDDDFFEIHTQMPAFQKLMENYTFTLRYTGRRWYGQMEPPNTNSKSFNEEEYHGEYYLHLQYLYVG